MSTLYKDSVIELTDQEIVFHRYHFPSGSDRRVSLSEVESVQVEPLSVRNGRYRLWGTGDFRTWNPNDYGRPNRDRIFIMRLRKSPHRESWVTRLLNSMTGRSFRHIAFTVQNSQQVASILKAQGLLHENPSV